MARNRITNPRTLRRLSQQIGFAVRGALTRGGTDHQIDVWGHPDNPRLIYSVYPDGTIEKREGLRVAEREQTQPHADPRKGSDDAACHSNET